VPIVRLSVVRPMDGGRAMQKYVCYVLSMQRCTLSVPSHLQPIHMGILAPYHGSDTADVIFQELARKGERVPAYLINLADAQGRHAR
jgi:hypothetical protein